MIARIVKFFEIKNILYIYPNEKSNNMNYVHSKIVFGYIECDLCKKIYMTCAWVLAKYHERVNWFYCVLTKKQFHGGNF